MCDVCDVFYEQHVADPFVEVACPCVHAVNTMLPSVLFDRLKFVQSALLALDFLGRRFCVEFLVTSAERAVVVVVVTSTSRVESSAPPVTLLPSSLPPHHFKPSIVFPLTRTPQRHEWVSKSGGHPCRCGVRL